ncbi:MAG: hypothetical protein ACKVZH_16805 [Blastocatellia bacterium]
MVKLYVDFNSCDEQGRVCLNTIGSLESIKQYGETLENGMKVLLFMKDEFEVQGTLFFEGIWLGIPDFSTIRYYNLDDVPK